MTLDMRREIWHKNAYIDYWCDRENKLTKQKQITNMIAKCMDCGERNLLENEVPGLIQRQRWISRKTKFPCDRGGQ